MFTHNWWHTTERSVYSTVSNNACPFLVLCGHSPTVVFERSWIASNEGTGKCETSITPWPLPGHQSWTRVRGCCRGAQILSTWSRVSSPALEWWYTDLVTLNNPTTVKPLRKGQFGSNMNRAILSLVNVLFLGVFICIVVIIIHCLRRGSTV